MRISETGFDLANKKNQYVELGNKVARSGFWDNPEAAKKTVTQLSTLKSIVEPAEAIARSAKDLLELFELAAAESDADTLATLETDLHKLEKKCDEIELQGLLNQPEDSKNCFFSIHAGAGGTESCDWVTMLLRMYTRYFERNKYKYTELDITDGEEAGIRSITLKVSGAFAFGKLSCETGVPEISAKIQLKYSLTRLVRQE